MYRYTLFIFMNVNTVSSNYVAFNTFENLYSKNYKIESILEVCWSHDEVIRTHNIHKTKHVDNI